MYLDDFLSQIFGKCEFLIQIADQVIAADVGGFVACRGERAEGDVLHMVSSVSSTITSTDLWTNIVDCDLLVAI